MVVVPEIVGYCLNGPVALVKTAVLGLIVVDPVPVVAIAVATVNVFALRVMNHLAATAADWYWEHSMPHETLD